MIFFLFLIEKRKQTFFFLKRRKKSCHSGDCYHVQRLYRVGWLGSCKQLKRCIQRHDGGPGWAVFVCETAEKASACLGGDASRGLWACLSLWAFEVWGFGGGRSKKSAHFFPPSLSHFDSKTKSLYSRIMQKSLKCQKTYFTAAQCLVP